MEGEDDARNDSLICRWADLPEVSGDTLTDLLSVPESVSKGFVTGVTLERPHRLPRDLTREDPRFPPAELGPAPLRDHGLDLTPRRHMEPWPKAAAGRQMAPHRCARPLEVKGADRAQPSPAAHLGNYLNEAVTQPGSVADIALERERGFITPARAAVAGCLYYKN